MNLESSDNFLEVEFTSANDVSLIQKVIDYVPGTADESQQITLYTMPSYLLFCIERLTAEAEKQSNQDMRENVTMSVLIENGLYFIKQEPNFKKLKQAKGRHSLSSFKTKQDFKRWLLIRNEVCQHPVHVPPPGELATCSRKGYRVPKWVHASLSEIRNTFDCAISPLAQVSAVEALRAEVDQDPGFFPAPLREWVVYASDAFHGQLHSRAGAIDLVMSLRIQQKDTGA